MIGNHPLPPVHVVDGHVVADSRDVATAFERDHRNVLATIREIVGKRPDLALTFQRKVARVSIGSGAQRDSHYYTMDRKGFVVLVGGFKGDRALDFRIAFYDAFEQMEATLARMEADAQALAAPARPAILDDPERLRSATAFVRAAHLAKGCPVARRAWDVAGLPDVFSVTMPSFALHGAVDPTVAAWADDRLERVDGKPVPTSWLYEDFREWADVHGHAVRSLSGFGKQLTRMGIVGFNSNGIKRRGVQLREGGVA